MPASQTAAALVAIGLAGLLPGCASLGKPAWL